MSLLGDGFFVWESGMFTNGWATIRLELTSTHLTWFPLSQSFFSFQKNEETQEAKGTIVLNQIQSALMASTADVEPPMGDDLEGLHVIKIRTTNRNYEPCLYAFGTTQQKRAKEWLVHVQKRMDQKIFSNLHRREMKFETLQIEMARWNFGFFSDGWTDNRLELTATGLEWYKMYFDVSNRPSGHIDYQDIHSMFTYIPSPVISVPSEFSSHLPSAEDLVGRFVFCVLFTDSHTPTNSSNKCGMYIFSFETESDRDLIGEEIWKRRKAILDNKDTPSSVLSLNPKPPLPTLSSLPPSSSSSSSSSSSPPLEPYSLFSDDTAQDSSSSSPPTNTLGSISSFFPKIEGLDTSKVRIDPPPSLPSLSSLSENLKNSFTRSSSPPSSLTPSDDDPSLLSSLSSSSTLSSLWGGKEEKGMNKVSSAPTIAKDEEGIFPSALVNFTEHFSSSSSSSPGSIEDHEGEQNSSFLSNVASSLGIENESGSERRSGKVSERSEQEEKSEPKSSKEGFHVLNEEDAFARKEFDNLSKELKKNSLAQEEEELAPNYFEINTGEEDDFDDDDDFFADAVTTQDYVLPTPKPEEVPDEEFGALFNKEPAKKAKGIEIRWSEVEL